MSGWCAESDCPPRRSARSPERDRTVHHFVNDRLSGEFFHNLTSLRRCDELCDVVLEAYGPSDAGGAESESAPPTIIAAHKVVLAAACPYFRFLLEQLDATNCLGIASFAQTHNCTQLAHAAQMFTHQHFRMLIESEEMLTMDEASFTQLISDDRLTTEGEEAVFEAVINWVKYDPSRKSSLPNVLAAVRLPLISQEFLLDRAYQEPLIQESPACIAMLCSVYHHILKKEVTPGLAASWVRPRQPVPLSQVELYDSRINRWRIADPLLEVRSGAGVAIYRDRVIAAGGHDGPLVRASVEMLGEDGWMHLPEMSVCRRNAGIVVANG
ncbi:kelch repeat protein [Necator americanus]|uniref:Kelch repeat protein n=1 Tax=Necator americanus TaxID=51031 RepID=W2T4A1_NECAM|nr:kelch repeat protein [Necator americanus]ETN76071.1 kelch repeat protein [Necator americanus]